MNARYCRSCGDEFELRDAFCGTCGSSRVEQTEFNQPPLAADFVEQPYGPAISTTDQNVAQASVPPVVLPAIAIHGSSNPLVAMCALISAGSCAASWGVSLVSQLVSDTDLEFKVINIVSLIISGVFGVGVPAAICIPAYKLMTQQGTTDQLRVVAVATFSLCSLRLPVFLAVLGPDDSWREYFHDDFFGVIGRLLSLLIPLGFVISISVARQQRLWIAIKSVRPSMTSLIMSALAILFTYLELSSRWPFPFALKVTALLALCFMGIVMLLPGDLGFPAPAMLGLFVGTVAVSSLIVRVMMNILFSTGEWDSSVLGAQIFRSAIVVGLASLLIGQHGGLRRQIQMLRMLVLP